MFITQYTLRIAPPIFLLRVQRASLPSLINTESHFISTLILHPSKINIRALSYISPKLWNSLQLYIRSIKSHKTSMKYIQQFISGDNL